MYIIDVSVWLYILEAASLGRIQLMLKPYKIIHTLVQATTLARWVFTLLMPALDNPLKFGAPAGEECFSLACSMRFKSSTARDWHCKF